MQFTSGSLHLNSRHQLVSNLLPYKPLIQALRLRSALCNCNNASFVLEHFISVLQRKKEPEKGNLSQNEAAQISRAQAVKEGRLPAMEKREQPPRAGGWSGFGPVLPVSASVQA